jgi:hypothetical protein
MIQPDGSPPIRELLDRNLQEVFGQGDDQRRRAAIDELWTEDAVLYVPPGIVEGRDAIDRGGFARNLTNKRYLLDAGNTGGGFGDPTYIAGEPRFYGVEIGGRF